MLASLKTMNSELQQWAHTLEEKVRGPDRRAGRGAGAHGAVGEARLDRAPCRGRRARHQQPARRHPVAHHARARGHASRTTRCAGDLDTHRQADAALPGDRQGPARLLAPVRDARRSHRRQRRHRAARWRCSSGRRSSTTSGPSARWRTTCRRCSSTRDSCRRSSSTSILNAVDAMEENGDLTVETGVRPRPRAR